MPARGIDQILPYSCPPTLHEPYVKNAHVYVKLAERAHGAIPKPASYAYIWGYALTVLQDWKPDLRLINLETSVTCSEDYWEGKWIHYRLHPKNVALLQAANIDCCSLANNHSLDWGLRGLTDTRAALDSVGIAYTGAGRNKAEAETPAIFKVHNRRVLVYGLAASSSGVPLEWAATPTQPGVHLIEDLSKDSAQQFAKKILADKRPDDITVVSIHWGDNWGYEVPEEQITFAHELVDSGAATVIHGHSSHHPKGMEIYRGSLILYGAGDFITDYEGITGYENFRGDLTCMYFVRLFPEHNMQINIVPVRVKNFQVVQTREDEADWLFQRLQEASAPFHTVLRQDQDGTFQATP